MMDAVIGEASKNGLEVDIKMEDGGSEKIDDNSPTILEFPGISGTTTDKINVCFVATHFNTDFRFPTKINANAPIENIKKWFSERLGVPMDQFMLTSDELGLLEITEETLFEKFPYSLNEDQNVIEIVKSIKIIFGGPVFNQTNRPRAYIDKKPTIKMALIRITLASHMKEPVTHVRLVFNGKDVLNEETPLSLGMKHGDILHVFKTEVMQIVVRIFFLNKDISLSINPEIEIGKIRSVIANSFKEKELGPFHQTIVKEKDWEFHKMHLYFKGQKLENTDTPKALKMQCNDVLLTSFSLEWRTLDPSHVKKKAEACQQKVHSPKGMHMEENNNRKDDACQNFQDNLFQEMNKGIEVKTKTFKKLEEQKIELGKNITKLELQQNKNMIEYEKRNEQAQQEEKIIDQEMEKTKITLQKCRQELANQQKLKGNMRTRQLSDKKQFDAENIKLTKEIFSFEVKKVDIEEEQNDLAEKQTVNEGRLVEFISNTIEDKMKDLECPVCFETAESPIFQCIGGHLICKKCLPTLKICPECRSQYPKIPFRNRFVEKMVDEIKKLSSERKALLDEI